jgi:hypothetical protein
MLPQCNTPHSQKRKFPKRNLQSTTIRGCRSATSDFIFEARSSSLSPQASSLLTSECCRSTPTHQTIQESIFPNNTAKSRPQHVGVLRHEKKSARTRVGRSCEHTLTQPGSRIAPFPNRIADHDHRRGKVSVTQKHVCGQRRKKIAKHKRSPGSENQTCLTTRKYETRSSTCVRS